MMAPDDWLVKICTNCYGHMTQMAVTPIYFKNYLNIFFSGTKTPMALGLILCSTGMRKFRIDQDFLIEHWHLIYIISVVFAEIYV